MVNEHEGVNILPHHYDQVQDHLIRLSDRSTVLENLINDQLETHITILPIDRFPGFKKKTTTSLIANTEVTDQPDYVLPKADIPYEFLIATGENSHYLLEASRAKDCQFHEWANCSGENYAVGAGPIIIRSLKEPASFFISSEGHHCAQSVIHDRRAQKCHIAGFEEFACCKTCAFESVCWNQDEQASLPCVS